MTKKRKFALFSLLSCFVVAGFALAMVVANLLSSPATASASGVTAPSVEIHFISLNKSKLEDSAKAIASDYQKIGAGGYTYFYNDYYHVFSSGFEIKNDAVRVQSNLAASGITSEIVTIKYNGFFISGSFSGEEKKVLQRSSSIFLSAYRNLFDLAIGLDTGAYNEISARLDVNAVHSSFVTACSDFSTLFQSNLSPAITMIAQALEKGEEITKALCSGMQITPDQTYASLVKYRYIELLSTYDTLSTRLT